MSRYYLGFAALLGLALAAGCASGDLPTAVVTGKVTYDGKPVPNGTVLFVPAAGPPATGEIQPDGSYRMTTYANGDGAVLGKHQVCITALQDITGRGAEERTPLPPPIIPEKYMHRATSGLTADVQPGENTIDFALTKQKTK
jgi:hypothetical protein